MLSISKLTKFFGGIKAVDDCSFDVPSKTITSLIGPNGAGKTTVFNLVSGMMEPDDGRIVFDGHDVSDWTAWRRSRLGLSRTFQLSRLFRNLSIEDNLLLALRQDDDRFFSMLWRGALERKSEHEAVRSMMKFIGLEKDPHAPVTELSYGQTKLFDLCRALLNPHTFLMLDEPVAGVNPVLREQFKKILRDLREKGETILLIEHDMDFVRSVSDHVIVMDQGKLLAQGSTETVLKDEKVLEAYLGSL